MSFFHVCDKATLNAKFIALTRGGMEGLAAVGLWAACGSQARGSRTDGHVSRDDAISLTLDAGLVDELGALLVLRGMWHAYGHDCERCPQPHAPGSWYFHDWKRYAYGVKADEDHAEMLNAERKNEAYRAALWARDVPDPEAPHIGACRFCGHPILKGTTGGRSPEVAHLDPSIIAGVPNMVLSCRTCNRRQGKKHYREAGLPLLDEPPHTPESIAAWNSYLAAEHPEINPTVRTLAPWQQPAAKGTPQQPTRQRDPQAPQPAQRPLREPDRSSGTGSLETAPQRDTTRESTQQPTGQRGPATQQHDVSSSQTSGGTRRRGGRGRKGPRSEGSDRQPTVSELSRAREGAHADAPVRGEGRGGAGRAEVGKPPPTRRTPRRPRHRGSRGGGGHGNGS